MNFEITKNGNLRFIMPPEEKKDIAELFEKCTHTDHGFLADLLEYAGWPGNGMLYTVRPEWVAALTDAPIVSDEVVYEDDGTVNVLGSVWWFPGYEMRSFAEELLRDGEVLFTAAPENAERKKP